MAEIKTKKITDLSEKTEVSDTDLFPVGNAGTASLRKTKWSSIWNKILSKIRAGVIVNNKTTTAEGYALDARMGKDLQDQITQLNTNSEAGTYLIDVVNGNGTITLSRSYKNAIILIDVLNNGSYGNSSIAGNIATISGITVNGSIYTGQAWIKYIVMET